jgi:toxin CcdB
MARFDVYELRQRYVVDVQTDFLSHLSTRVVIPLFPVPGPVAPATGLNPVVTIERKDFALWTQALAALPLKDLKGPVASLAAHRDEITRALDILLTGF